MFKLSAIIIVSLFCFSNTIAQKKPANKFKKIDASTHQKKVHPLNNAIAIALVNAGSTVQKSNNNFLDEMPKSIGLKFNEKGEGYFEYVMAQAESIISFRRR